MNRSHHGRKEKSGRGEDRAPSPTEQSLSAPGELTTGERSSFEAPLRAAGLSEPAVHGCVQHFALLRRWNRTHNLTRILDPEEAAVRHYLDSALPALQAPRAAASFVDVGSGAGFPGLVVAVVRHGSRALLVEPARKRASFLQVAAGAIGLSGVSVVPPARKPTSMWVLSRATFSKNARQELWPYVLPGGVLWAWTTATERDTWQDLVSTWPDARLQWIGYALPGLGERWIAVLHRSAPQD
jgi:16S rRNA (guanine(527)-N(7))-methyltransferase RsmG